MFSSLSIGNTTVNDQFNSIFNQGNRTMEIRKLDPSNPEDAKLLNTLDDELYQGDDESDYDDDDGLYQGDDIEYDGDYEDDHEIEDDMDDDEHRIDYINKLNER